MAKSTDQKGVGILHYQCLNPGEWITGILGVFGVSKRGYLEAPKGVLCPPDPS